MGKARPAPLVTRRTRPAKPSRGVVEALPQNSCRPEAEARGEIPYRQPRGDSRPRLSSRAQPGRVLKSIPVDTPLVAKGATNRAPAVSKLNQYCPYLPRTESSSFWES